RTPGKSLTRPPRISTTLCSCKLWPIPGIYAFTSMLFDKRTRAYLRNAELGFLGVIVPTRVQTPRFCGEYTVVTFFFMLLYPLFNAGAVECDDLLVRGLRTNWLIVGIFNVLLSSFLNSTHPGGSF